MCLCKGLAVRQQEARRRVPVCILAGAGLDLGPHFGYSHCKQLEEKQNTKTTLKTCLYILIFAQAVGKKMILNYLAFSLLNSEYK